MSVQTTESEKKLEQTGWESSCHNGCLNFTWIFLVEWEIQKKEEKKISHNMGFSLYRFLLHNDLKTFFLCSILNETEVAEYKVILVVQCTAGLISQDVQT